MQRKKEAKNKPGVCCSRKQFAAAPAFGELPQTNRAIEVLRFGSSLLSRNFSGKVFVALGKAFADHIQRKGADLGSLAL